uniref:P2X purinoceptor n=1 Tax=Sander lucioperca TaxID=283035 RepID=A0A8C9WWG1_SANLU
LKLSWGCCDQMIHLRPVGHRDPPNLKILNYVLVKKIYNWVFIHEKAYQVTDTGIESSVMTKVKGFGYHGNRVMDVADYVFPQQGADIFCIMTKLIVTENQFQGKCAEVRTHLNHWLPISSRVITGVCIQPSNNTENGRCEIEGWCPAENDLVEIRPMLDVNNFTIFIKNSIRFPLFNVTRGNFPTTMTAAEIKSCTYHPETRPFCPIFLVGDVLNYTGQNVDDLGGEIGINIEWKCNLDLDIDYCVPKYSFTRLDAPFAKNAISKGYNFRFAKYFKTENGTDFRTLHKAFAIRFDVMVTGNAGKFNTIPTLINLVAAFTSVGLVRIFLCDIILLNFLKGAEQYKAKKFEEVMHRGLQWDKCEVEVYKWAILVHFCMMTHSRCYCTD